MNRFVAFLTAALTVCALVLGFLWYRPIGGYRVQAVLSGSMGNAMPVGSLIVVRQESPWNYQKGDIVSFLAPRPALGSVTHRIVSLSNSNGVHVMRTKGDANPQEDPWLTSLGAITGRVTFVIPWLGYVVAYLKTPIGFICFALATLVLCVWGEVVTIILFLRRLTFSNKLPCASPTNGS